MAAVLIFNWFNDKEEAPVKEDTLVNFDQLREEQTETAGETGRTWLEKKALERRNNGICKNLTQDAKVLLVFVNDDESSWTRQEMNKFISDLVDPALEYIEYYATRYGHSISMEDCTFLDDGGNIMPVRINGSLSDGNDETAGVITLDLVSATLDAYGFSDKTQLMENVQSYAGTEQVAVMFCVDKPGRSFANTGANPESVVLYTSYKGADSRASVFAHELMHLFGAEDMYDEGGLRANRYAMAKQMHPNELFCGEQWNLYDNIISSYTAYAVGWLDKLPAEYDCIEWWS